jgi:hypothetical protein
MTKTDLVIVTLAFVTLPSCVLIALGVTRTVDNHPSLAGWTIGFLGGWLGFWALVGYILSRRGKNGPG